MKVCGKCQVTSSSFPCPSHAIFRISNAKKPKDTEFKAKDAENLDKQNMRDVQLSEYEKRKRQMKELDKLVSLSLQDNYFNF